MDSENNQEKPPQGPMGEDDNLASEFAEGATPQTAEQIEEDIDDHILLKKSRKRDITIGVIALMLTIGVTYFLTSNIPRSWLKDVKQVGTITTTGTIRQRHAGSWQWTDVKAQEKEVPIYLRDIVYVPKDSKATVVLSKQTIELPPDTMIQFDETSLDRFEVTLIDIAPNQVMPLPTKTSKLAEYLEDIRGLELRASELKSRTMSRIFAPIELVRAEKMKKNEFRLTTLLDYDVKPLAPKTDRYNLRANRWMPVNWSPIPMKDVNFRLEIAKDSGFRKTLTHNTKKNLLIVQFDEEAIYYWRVTASLGANKVVSSAATFSMVLKGGKGPLKPGAETPAASPAPVREVTTVPKPNPAAPKR